jgi:hypothetical protein
MASRALGAVVGELFGLIDGLKEDSPDGKKDDARVAAAVGSNVGRFNGFNGGSLVRKVLWVGRSEHRSMSRRLGLLDGSIVGSLHDLSDGALLGATVGSHEGYLDGSAAITAF